MPWLALVRQARTRDDVVRVARDFVSELTDTELDRLPIECRPGAIANEADLQQYALQLARHHAHGDAARVIFKISAFFSSAASRLAELATIEPPAANNE